MSKDTQRITQINDQGEIVGGFVAVIRPKQKSSFQRHFTMNQDALKILAKELTGEQFKVLMLMLADLDYENFIQIAQADIADALEMQKTHVSRAVRALLDVGVIFEGPKVGRYTGRQNLISGMPQMTSLCGVSPILHRIKTNAPYHPCHAIASVAVFHVQYAAVFPFPGFAA
ncbi:hypothetical protein [Escherichia coli]|uniref:hypothetical protein n=4 Tax=Gammaproteobacteria TaxID=1236 RepID=UPI002A8107D8|nr:hypothetical protein [Escherichia coli]